jgi:hypothetical protein
MSWHPHLMFFIPGNAAKSWGANLPGSPVMAADDFGERVTIFLVWVGKWSDATPTPQTTHRTGIQVNSAAPNNTRQRIHRSSTRGKFRLARHSPAICEGSPPESINECVGDFVPDQGWRGRGKHLGKLNHVARRV